MALRRATRDTNPVTINADDTAQSALAFDWGERRIGVAFANKISDSATTLTTIMVKTAADAETAVLALVTEWQPEALVVGVPYNIDGSESESTEKALAFADRIAKQTGLAVAQIDERLTSFQAREILTAQRQSGKRKRRIRREDIDKLAAKLIAETWLREP